MAHPARTIRASPIVLIFVLLNFHGRIFLHAGRSVFSSTEASAEFEEFFMSQHYEGGQLLIWDNSEQE